MPEGTGAVHAPHPDAVLRPSITFTTVPTRGLAGLGLPARDERGPGIVVDPSCGGGGEIPLVGDAAEVDRKVTK